MRIDALVSQVLAQLSPLVAQSPPKRSALQLLLAGGSGNAGLSAAPASASRSSVATDESALPPAADSSGLSDGELAPFARLTDQFVRQRSIVSYSLPGKGPFGANIDVVLEVESAYRQIDLLAPVGKALDINA